MLCAVVFEVLLSRPASQVVKRAVVEDKDFLGTVDESSVDDVWSLARLVQRDEILAVESLGHPIRPANVDIRGGNWLSGSWETVNIGGYWLNL